MDCRTHERGVGMLNTPYVKKDTIKTFPRSQRSL